MRTHSKVILAALAATMLLSIAVGGAAARNLMVNERNFEWVWSELLGAPKTKLEFINRTAGVNVQCRVTYLGNFTEFRVVKETVRNQRQIKHVEVETCTGGVAIPLGLPWVVRYRGFTGRLPFIDSIIWAVFQSWRIREPNGVECEAASEVNHPAVYAEGSTAEASETGLERTGDPENVTAERGARIPLRGEFLCSISGEGEIGGIGLVRNLPRTGFITYTLI